MTPARRLAGGICVLAVYAWALKPAPGKVGRAIDADSETWLTASSEAFRAGRYAEALDPTSRLVEHFPHQQVYAERLAHIFEKLGRAPDEAAAWERFIDSSPTPVDACPSIG